MGEGGGDSVAGGLMGCTGVVEGGGDNGAGGVMGNTGVVELVLLGVHGWWWWPW